MGTRETIRVDLAEVTISIVPSFEDGLLEFEIEHHAVKARFRIGKVEAMQVADAINRAATLLGEELPK